MCGKMVQTHTRTLYQHQTLDFHTAMYDEATGENWVKGTKDFSALYFNFLLLKKKVQNKKLKSNPNYMQTWLYITNISIWL